MSLEFEYYINGGSAFGTSRKEKVSIFLDKIAELYDPEKRFDGFIAYMVATELHEICHIYGNIDCGYYYRTLTDIISSYLRDGNWKERYTKHLKKIIRDIEVAKKNAIEDNDHICHYCIHDEDCDISLIIEEEFHEFLRDCNDFEHIN